MEGPLRGHRGGPGVGLGQVRSDGVLCHLWGLELYCGPVGSCGPEGIQLYPPSQQYQGATDPWSQDGRMRDRWVLWDQLPKACWPGCSAQMQRQISFLAYQVMTLVYLNRRPGPVPGLFFLSFKQWKNNLFHNDYVILRPSNKSVLGGNGPRYKQGLLKGPTVCIYLPQKDSSGWRWGT